MVARLQVWHFDQVKASANDSPEENRTKHPHMGIPSHRRVAVRIGTRLSSTVVRCKRRRKGPKACHQFPDLPDHVKHSILLPAPIQDHLRLLRSLSHHRSTSTGTRVIEDFEGSGTYHVLFPPATAQVSSAAAHDGSFGLIMHNGGDYIYRDDPAAIVQEGQTISAWVQFHQTVDGQAYFLFGANAAVGASYALVLAGGSKKMYFQEVFFGSPLNSTIGTPVSQTFKPNHWYRIQIAWGTDGSMTGQLYDSNGTTLLNTVHASATLLTSGGIGFRGTGHDKYFDTVTVTSGAPPLIAYSVGAPPGPGEGEIIVLEGRRQHHRHNDSDTVFVRLAESSVPADASHPSGERLAELVEEALWSTSGDGDGWYNPFQLW
jgi:hypothetical protein